MSKLTELEQETGTKFNFLTKLSDGLETLAITSNPMGKIGKDGLMKHLKDGWILSEDYDKNCDTIVEWKRLKVYISDWKEIIKLQTDLVAMTQEDIISIESGSSDEAASMLISHRENLEKWQKSLVTKKRQLGDAKVEFKSVTSVIKSLKDKFKLYISQLEEEG